MDLTSSVRAITVGIRFSKSFRITDISGNIIDDLLYGPSTPFGTKIFTQVQENTRREKILYNEESNEYLRVNTDDIILGIKVEDFDKSYKWINDKVISYFKNSLFSKHKINNILRIGVIFHHKLDNNGRFKEIISQITTNKVKDLRNIDLSFSKKLPALVGLKKGVNDYKNTIYQFMETKKYLFANLDYQHYYEPAVEDLRDCEPEEKLISARDYLVDDFYKWLSSYGSENK